MPWKVMKDNLNKRGMKRTQSLNIDNHRDETHTPQFSFCKQNIQGSFNLRT